MNIRALRRRQPHSASLSRYTEIARLLTGQAAATGEEGVRWVRELCADLRIPPLRSYGLRAEDVSELCQKAAQASSMKANPLPLTADELREILSSAI